MGRKLLPLMMSLCLLAGCAGGGTGSQGEELASQIRSEFSAMTACQGQARLTADYGQRVFECLLDVRYDSVSGCDLTLLEPELAAGVRAHLDPQGSVLAYDDFSLETGPVTDDGLSPVGALPALYRQVTQGYLASWTLEDGVLSLSYRDPDAQPGQGLEAQARFDAQTRAPLSGELYWDGVRVVAVRMEAFQMMGGAS